MEHIFDTMDKNKLTYKKFMHTWKMKDGVQNIWDKIIPQRIDYSEYKLLNPDYYTIDDEDEFLSTVNMEDYTYNDDSIINEDPNYKGWTSKSMWLSNYICMLESQKRGFQMVKHCVENGDTFKFIIFMRPDITIYDNLPVDLFFKNCNMIHIPDNQHWSGINDQVAIMNYEYGCIYGRRIDELAEYRKMIGLIVAEKYCKYILVKYNMDINIIKFNYSITRPF
jgi:hypothetical protein